MIHVDAHEEFMGACYGLVCKDGRVVRGPALAQWMVGRHVDDIVDVLRNKSWKITVDRK